MALALTCSKCSGEIEEGLVFDVNDKGTIPSMWVEDQAGNGATSGGVDNHKRKVKTLTTVAQIVISWILALSE